VSSSGAGASGRRASGWRASGRRASGTRPLYDLLQWQFRFPLLQTNSVDMAKIAGSNQQTKMCNQLVFAMKTDLRTSFGPIR
jgi:hypothetical protein